jgi:hypothetical protein
VDHPDCLLVLPQLFGKSDVGGYLEHGLHISISIYFDPLAQVVTEMPGYGIVGHDFQSPSLDNPEISIQGRLLRLK